MSIPENTRRLLDHGDDLHGVLRRALRAEQSLGASTPSAERRREYAVATGQPTASATSSIGSSSTS